MASSRDLIFSRMDEEMSLCCSWSHRNVRSRSRSLASHSHKTVARRNKHQNNVIYLERRL